MNALRRLIPVASLMSATLLAGTSASMGDDSPQWGERWSRNMVSPEKGLPASFVLGEREYGGERIDNAKAMNVRWTAALGDKTYGSPVVAEGRVLIGTNNGQPRNLMVTADRGVLQCYDEATGAFQWQLLVPKRDELRFFDSPKTGVTCTPTVLDGRVYLTTNRCEVVCLDLDGLADGNDGPFTDEAVFMTDPRENAPHDLTPRDADILWVYNMVDQAGVRSHDAANGCPLIHDGLLYIPTANGLDEEHAAVAKPEAPSLLVIDIETGQAVARDDDWVGADVVHGQWSSPAMGVVDGRELIVWGGGNGRLHAFEPLSRDKLDEAGELTRIKTVWTFDGQPCLREGEAFTFEPGRGSESFTCVATPVIHDDKVYMAFGHDPWMGRKLGWFACIDAKGEGDVTKSGLLWSSKLERESLASPSIADGLVYIADNGGFVYCLDAATGKEQWRHEGRGPAWGSTYLVDGRLYYGTSRRDLRVFAPGRKCCLIAEMELPDAMYGTPTAANRTLYIATNCMLYAIGASE